MRYTSALSILMMLGAARAAVFATFGKSEPCMKDRRAELIISMESRRVPRAAGSRRERADQWRPMLQVPRKLAMYTILQSQEDEDNLSQEIRRWRVFRPRVLAKSPLCERRWVTLWDTVRQGSWNIDAPVQPITNPVGMGSYKFETVSDLTRFQTMLICSTSVPWRVIGGQTLNR